MAIKRVNIGAVADDGTGDRLRTAFEKVNENFDEVEQTGRQTADALVEQSKRISTAQSGANEAKDGVASLGRVVDQDRASANDGISAATSLAEQSGLVADSALALSQDMQGLTMLMSADDDAKQAVIDPTGNLLEGQEVNDFLFKKIEGVGQEQAATSVTLGRLSDEVAAVEEGVDIYSLAPLASATDTADSQKIDVAGNVISGDAAVQAIRASIPDFAFAPLSSATDSEATQQLDIQGNLVGGEAVNIYILGVAKGGGTPIPNPDPDPQPKAGLSFKIVREMPSIVDGKLYSLGASGLLLRSDPSPYAFSGGPMISGPAILTTINQPSVQEQTPVAVGEVGEGWFSWVMANGKTILFIIPVLGQSNSVGARGVPLLPVGLENVWPESLLMPDDGLGSLDVRFGMMATGDVPAFDPSIITGFAPLLSKSNGNRGVTSSEGFAHAMAHQAERSLGFVPRCVFVNPGWGGTALSGLAKGTQIYSNMISNISRLAALARARGWEPYIPFALWYHGEADSNSSSYYAGMQTYRSDVAQDFVAITGQADTRIPFMMCQLMNFFDDRTRSAETMYRLARDLPESFGITGPGYAVPMADDFLHYSPIGHFRNGERDFVTLARSFFSTGRTQPGLMPVKSSVAYDGTVVTFQLPYRSMRDSESISDPGAGGFKSYSGPLGTEVPVSSIAVASDGLSVQIVPSAPLEPGAGRCITYALNSKHKMDTGRLSIADAARGQIRASKPLGVSQADGLPLYDWLVGFKENF